MSSTILAIMGVLLSTGLYSVQGQIIKLGKCPEYQSVHVDESMINGFHYIQGITSLIPLPPYQHFVMRGTAKNIDIEYHTTNPKTGKPETHLGTSILIKEPGYFHTNFDSLPILRDVYSTAVATDNCSFLIEFLCKNLCPTYAHQQAVTIYTRDRCPTPSTFEKITQALQKLNIDMSTVKVVYQGKC